MVVVFFVGLKVLCSLLCGVRFFDLIINCVLKVWLVLICVRIFRIGLLFVFLFSCICMRCVFFVRDIVVMVFVSDVGFVFRLFFVSWVSVKGLLGFLSRFFVRFVVCLWVSLWLGLKIRKVVREGLG